tara:strand:+ start:1446 stop:2660 length:1215 start_codon:yes stop_codon:yes gene_type:complete
MSAVLQSSLNLKTIRRSVGGLTQAVKRAQLSASDISDNIDGRNRAKQESVSMSATLFQRRREALKKRQKEELFEAQGFKGSFRRIKKIAADNTKGFLGRIMDFVGTVLIGWAVVNLPRIVKLAENLMMRMRKYFDILNDFGKSVMNFLIGTGKGLNEILTSIISYDFRPIKESIETQLAKISRSMKDIERDIMSGIAQLTGMTEEQLLKMLNIELPKQQVSEEKEEEIRDRISEQLEGDEDDLFSQLPEELQNALILLANQNEDKQLPPEAIQLIKDKKIKELEELVKKLSTPQEEKKEDIPPNEQKGRDKNDPRQKSISPGRNLKDWWKNLLNQDPELSSLPQNRELRMNKRNNNDQTIVIPNTNGGSNGNNKFMNGQHIPIASAGLNSSKIYDDLFLTRGMT